MATIATSNNINNATTMAAKTSISSACLNNSSINNDEITLTPTPSTSVSPNNSEGYNNIPPSPFGTPFVTNQNVNNFPSTAAAKPPTGIVKVGFYEVEGTIGRGNFAVVKIAKHRITKTDVSIFD
jgi:hypothetical protein